MFTWEFEKRDNGTSLSTVDSRTWDVPPRPAHRRWAGGSLVGDGEVRVGGGGCDDRLRSRHGNLIAFDATPGASSSARSQFPEGAADCVVEAAVRDSTSSSWRMTFAGGKPEYSSGTVQVMSAEQCHRHGRALTVVEPGARHRRRGVGHGRYGAGQAEPFAQHQSAQATPVDRR